MLYSRPELRLLVALAAILLAGLAVREWRAGFPGLADRLERFDQDEPVPPAVPAGADTGPGRTAPSPTPGGGDLRLGPSSLTAAPGRAPVPDAPANPATPRPEAVVDVVPSPAADPRPLDLNRATAAELSRLPGVGAGLAQRIVEERQRRGRFDSPDALRHVLGMGPKKLAALRDLVTVGE